VKTTVGILGAGQLGCMLASALHDLDAEVRFYDPDPRAPGMRRFAGGRVASFSDEGALSEHLRACDVVTVEMEHVDTAALRKIGARLVPSVDVIETAGSRRKEKAFLRARQLPHVAFATAHDVAELRAAVAEVGAPCIVKTSLGGYDGRGQWRIEVESAAATVIGAIGHALGERFSLTVEERVDLAQELSCIVARDGTSEVVFPLFENVHEAGVLDLTMLPARVDPRVAEAARDIALETARALDVKGLLAVEFFVLERPPARSPSHSVAGVHLCINELAPRPHNSGHVTRVATDVSQFDMLARVLLGVPLATPRLVDPGGWCMANLLGERFGADGALATTALGAAADGLCELVLYGKPTAVNGRKMGHLSTRGADVENARASARRLRDALTVTR